MLKLLTKDNKLKDKREDQKTKRSKEFLIKRSKDKRSNNSLMTKDEKGY